MKKCFHYDKVFDNLSGSPVMVATGEKGDISGYWKLVKDEKTSMGDGVIVPFAYSGYYVIYHFQADNKLTITGVIIF